MTLTAPPSDELFSFDGRPRRQRTAPSPPEGSTAAAAPQEVRGGRIPHQPALDGLRGAAVLAVVLYHAEFSIAGHQVALGGFLGVDAFFVLSGFLITSLLLSEWSTGGRIALGDFWSRRARRLLPAMFAALGLVVAYTVFFAKPDNYDQIRWDGIATMFYVGNWRFIFSGQSYFQQFLFRSPLQHMWSLAIEEQWYLIWPLIVMGVLAWTRSVRAVFWTSVLLATASVLWMAFLFEPGKDPSRLYYGTDTRAQSLLVGAALAAAVAGGLRTRSVLAQRLLGWGALAVAAVVAVAWSRTTDAADWVYTGGFLLLSTGVAFVIFAATQPGKGIDNPIRSALSFAPLRWLGLISYGVYVYHWPLFMMINGDHTGLDGTALFAVRMLATLGLATLSYFALEKPIRFGALRRIRFAPALLPITAVVTLVVMLAVTADAHSTLAFEKERDLANRPRPELGASTADPTAPPPSRVLLVGDSVAYNLGLGFEGEVDERSDIRLWNQAILWCELIQAPRMEKEREKPASDTCKDWKTQWSGAVADFQPDLSVVNVGAWEIFDRKIDDRWVTFGSPEFDTLLTNRLQEVVDTMGSSGAPVVLLTSPYFERNDGVSASEWTQNDHSRVDHFNDLLRAVAGRDQNKGKVFLLDLGHYLCPDGTGACREKIDNVLIRDDGLHYGEEGSRVVAAWLAPQFRKLAVESAAARSGGATSTTAPGGG